MDANRLSILKKTGAERLLLPYYLTHQDVLDELRIVLVGDVIDHDVANALQAGESEGPAGPYHPAIQPTFGLAC